MSVPTALILALIAVESGGNDHAWGDNGKAWGCLQIRAEVMEDVARISPQDHYYNAFRRDDAIWICRTYLDHYVTRSRLGRIPTAQDYARVWNGGPQGWKKDSTLPYWEKVRKHYLKSRSLTNSKPNSKALSPPPQVHSLRS